MKKEAGLVRNAGAMSIAVLLSRFLGLIREQVFAYIFGAGFYSDASLVAYRIPNLLRDLLAEGALSSSFVSVFSKEKDLAHRQDLYRKVTRLLVWILIFVTGIIFCFSDVIVQLMAGAFREIPGKFELTVELTKILSPFLLFTSLSALSMGLLNSLGLYFLPALGAAAFNLSSIFVGGLGAYFFHRQYDDMRGAAIVFACGTLLGGFLSWAIQWRSQSKKGFSAFSFLKNFFDFKDIKRSISDRRIHRMISMLAPAVLTVGVVQVNIFVNTGLAAELPQGSVTWLNYAYRLLHFPLGVFGVSLFMAALPKLSELSADKAAFEKTLREAVGLSLYVSIGAAVGLFVFSEPIIAILFEHGRFTSLDVKQSALALQAYAVGLLAFNLNKIFTSAFFALESVWTPALLSLISILVNYFFSVFLSQRLGHAGIALSVSLTSLMSSFMLALFLRKKQVHVSFFWASRIFLGSLLCALPMLIAYYFGIPQHIWNMKSQSFSLSLLLLMFIVFVGAMSYLLLSISFLRQGRSFYDRILKPRIGRYLK